MSQNFSEHQSVYSLFLRNNFVLIYLLRVAVVFVIGSVYSVIDYQIEILITFGNLILISYWQFNLRVKPWRIFFIAFYGFMQNIVVENVEDCLVEKRNFDVNIRVRKSFFPDEIVNCSFDKISICFFMMPNFS